MGRLPAEKRKSQLLDIAEDLFARLGYARTTTAELAKAAGVTEPIIYRHFDSKRELFVDLIERTAARTLAKWEAHLSGATDPSERLRRLLADNPLVSDDPAEQASYRVFLQAISEADDEAIQGAVARHINDLHAFIRREVERAQDARKLTRVFPSDIIAWLLIDIGMGYGVLSAMRIAQAARGNEKKARTVQQVLERLLVGKAE